MQKLPLEGIRVADFSWVLAGPHCTQWLGLMGAEIIKLETNKRLDMMRMSAFAEGKRDIERAGAFHMLNYNKKSCTLDLTQPKAIEIVKKLVKISDVTVENFAPGVIDKMGLGYTVLKSIKPDIIFVSSSGLGSTGPDRGHVAYGSTLHSFSGLCSITGYAGGPPRTIGGTYTDPLTGVTMTFAILAALYHRAKTGEGQFIDLSMAESTIAQLPEAIMDYTMNSRVAAPSGNEDGAMAPHGCYPCKGNDKWVAIAVSNDAEWKSLCHAMGNPDWCKEKRFADQYSRYRNKTELDKLVGEWTKNYTNYEVMQILQKAGVAAGPSTNIDDMVADPHLKERGLYKELDYPDIGKRPIVAAPWKLSRGFADYKIAPHLGEHNEYVFHELLKMPHDDIKKLMEEKVIF